MYEVRKCHPIAGVDAWLLSGESTAVTVMPSRGGLVARIRVEDDELLYLDESTLSDPSHKVRGGVPVLFPLLGRLEENRYEVEGRRFEMPPHGFARTLPWSIVSTEANEEGARMTLRLSHSEQTLALYPWRFEARLSLTLQGTRVMFELEVENKDETALEYQAGFHPYFRVPDEYKQGAHVETDALYAIDGRTGERRAVGTPDFTAEELDWRLEDHALPGTLLSRPPLRPIRLEWGDGFDTLVLWTLEKKDFVCVEPWTSQAGGLGESEGVRRVEPGGVDRLWWALSV